MSAFDQPVTTFSDTGAHGRAISDYIFNVDPMDTPVVAHFGLDSANAKFRLNASAGGKNVKIELIEDTYQPLTTAISNGTVALTTATLSFAVADGSLLQDGMVIKVNAELMVISAVSTNTVTVDSRSYGGTNATHAATAAITIVGMARKQGDDADYIGLTSVSVPYNYTSIFQKGIKVTGTENVLGQYGKSSEYDYQMNKVVPELSRWIERAFFYAVRRQGSATVASSLGGVDTYVTSNSSAITTVLTKTAVETVTKAIYDDGCTADLCTLGTGAAQTAYDLMDTSSFVRITQENTIWGMRPLAVINSQFATDLRMLVSRHCPATKAYFLDSGKVGFYTYRPLSIKSLPPSGDYMAGEAVGEFSMLIANGSLAHGFIKTTAASL